MDILALSSELLMDDWVVVVSLEVVAASFIEQFVCLFFVYRQLLIGLLWLGPEMFYFYSEHCSCNLDISVYEI